MPWVGARVITGSMIAAKRVDDYTIEFRRGREGVLSERIVRTVSRDGKTMTMKFTTPRPGGGSDTGGSVFVKQ